MTTELFKVSTSCLIAVKNMSLSSLKRYIKDPVRFYFGLLKNLGKLKARDFNATSLSTYDFSTLYTTLPHNLIKNKLIDHIERNFNREGSPYLACNDRNAFFTLKNPENIMHDLDKNVCHALNFLLDNIFIRFGTNVY